MAIWQNFKDTDHEFEKKFFTSIALLITVIFLYYLFDLAVDKFPDVRILFLQYGVIFLSFFTGVIILALITGTIYYRTLDFWEAETAATKNACIINVILWSCFWTCWSIVCAWITLKTWPTTILVLSVIFMLASIPGLIAFLISKSIRTTEELQMRKNNFDIINPSETEPYTIFLERKYYTGYYGLICIPVYLATVLVGYFFK